MVLALYNNSISNVLNGFCPPSIKTFALILILTIYSGAGVAQQAGMPTISGINNVAFKQSKFDQNFAGNGFLIEHKQKIYAVTVKHVLLEAKTNKMKTVWLRDELKSWKIHPNNDETKFVQLGRLINSDRSEKIDIQTLQKDWLLFEVKDNQSDFVPLKIRTQPLAPKEQVTALGCSYANQLQCSQDSYIGYLKSYDRYNLRVHLQGIKSLNLAGLSGSPVVDKNMNLVGIVSNILPSSDGKDLDFAPARLDYLLSILP
jgi:hypothetical protein